MLIAPRYDGRKTAGRVARRVEHSRLWVEDGPKSDLVLGINGRQAVPDARVVALARDGQLEGPQSSARCVRTRGIDSADRGRARGQKAGVLCLQICIGDTAAEHRRQWEAFVPSGK